ncbi:MAG: type II CRISPR RNA-guided endonuclease Cas9 [Bacilli bacterium]|nr:type II CRISPR RNA-guided endonuclease Cas9 [Bacilli bacterium]
MTVDNRKKYSIGLDIGTSSVGWAVINNDNFKVMRKGNKKLWGVRLFDEAQSAAERRLYRSTRRRYDRRRERIKLLQEIFCDEIQKNDVNFFKKLKESFYREDDLENKTIHMSVAEKNMIKNFHDKYPTIYHLRSRLVNNPQKEDVRLVYLALHHIIKYRGNFLYSNDNFDVDNLDIIDKLHQSFETLVKINDSLGFDEEHIGNIDYKELEKALLAESKKDRERLIKECLKTFENKNFINEFTKLMIGNKSDLVKLFGIEYDSKLSISFKGTDYDGKLDEIEKIISTNMEVINLFKEVYDMVFLKSLFKGADHTNISDLMVSKFEKHKEDLKFLKSILCKNRKEYNKILRTIGKTKCVYDKYVHNDMSYKDFINAVKKSIEICLRDINDQKLISLYQDIKLAEMENEQFMPRITDSDNGKYPYQLNKKELKTIIENQGKYYPFLLDKVNGVYKIEKILSFKIPYFVGPLNNTTNIKGQNNQNSWVQRKVDNVKITPYNFEEVVDLDASAEKFIKRMISNCTYILNEPSIPNNSILYSKFKVYNELKQIKVNNEKLTSDMIGKVYNELFLKQNGNITNNVFVDYLKTLDEFSMYNDFNITGYSALNKFANNMQPYIDFFGPDGIFENTNYDINDAEEIIEWITIFEDKSILERKVVQKYCELSDSKIRKILSKKYKGWSQLSRKLLETKYYEDKNEGTKKSIMDLMIETKLNFMQIINDKKYNFQKMIDKFNVIENITKLDYSVVADLATSPAVKRGIYQSLKIVREIVNYIGYEPYNIILEMAREDGKKQRTQSRKNKLVETYKKAKNSIDNYNQLFKELNGKEEKELSKEKLYLYFLQEGKSLYSGRPLNIDNLDNYEVDHIIPRTLIKDDSIDNKALVLREENQAKASSFVLPEQFRSKSNIVWWENLKKKGLLSDKKINNLKRYKYSDADINGFINRQIVETRQITKHIANILNTYYKKTKVIYLKASFSSDFRSKFELFKYRSLNDFHHTHDAYLATVLGVYKDAFFKDVDFETLKKNNYEIYQSGKYKYNKKYGYLINNIDPEIVPFDKETGEVLIDNAKFIDTITNTLYNSDILVSKKTEIRTGQFYEQNMSKKGTKTTSLKKGLSTELYGGYSRVLPGYGVIVKFNKKGKTSQRMIGMPIYIDKLNNDSAKINYIKNLLGLKDNESVEIIKDKIPFHSIIDWNGQICSLRGATDKVEVCNAKEFIIDKEHLKEWKYSLNRVLNNKETDKITEEVYNKQLSEIVIYIVDKIESEYKLYNDLVPNMKNNFMIDRIDTLTVHEKEIIIVQMLRLLKFNRETANLKEFNNELSSAFGKKEKRIIEHGKIIYNSVTGLYGDTYEF